MSSRQPWTEDECLLAIWAYDRMDRQRDINKAELYREVSALIGRTPKSVEYKVQNVSHCDSRPRSQKPISEMPNIQRRLKELFEAYWTDKAYLESVYRRIQGSTRN